MDIKQFVGKTLLITKPSSQALIPWGTYTVEYIIDGDGNWMELSTPCGDYSLMDGADTWTDEDGSPVKLELL